MEHEYITITGASEHNLKNCDVRIPRNQITVVTGVSGSGKSSLVFDTILKEAQRRFFYTLSHYSRQFVAVGQRPKVRSITGLSPAIGLAQFETRPSSRATVGTLTDLTELLGILFSRFADAHCPTHGLSTRALTHDEMVRRISETFAEQLVGICIPIAEKKLGGFAKELERFSEKGFVHVLIDGDVQALAPAPILDPKKRHTIKLIIDQLRVKPAPGDRLASSIKVAIEMGEGFVECIPLRGRNAFVLENLKRYSTAGSCPACGYSAPKLDARYFNPNSLGQCPACRGLGTQQAEDAEGDTRLPPICAACVGTGLTPECAHLRIADRSVLDFSLMPITDLHPPMASLLERADNPAMRRVLGQIVPLLEQLLNARLGYLHLSRRIRSLSGGEYGRLKLASILSERLRGVLYILDEPSQGLHPTELTYLQANLTRLKDAGNTIIIVDHDEYFIRAADWVVDLGPEGGAGGGQIVAAFSPKMADRYVDQSATAAFLCRSIDVPISRLVPAVSPEMIVIRDARLHNLQIPTAQFQVGALNVVEGVSGAGKTSLLLHTLLPNALARLAGNLEPQHCSSFELPRVIEAVERIDRNPIARSGASTPATYLDVFTAIRTLFGQLPDAQIMGFDARSFSLNAIGGRCEECGGRGELVLTMRFLPDARVPCPYCNGSRYKDSVLQVKYDGLSIADVLNLSISAAAQQFKNHRAIVRKLQVAIELGLGYLKLGQPTASLSGGEAQRLKLGTLSSKPLGARSLLIMDEPTLGLHHNDVVRLLKFVNRLTQDGTTVIVIEHNPDVIAAADWVVSLGPGSATDGGRLLYNGPYSRASAT